ncbi:E3 ubiquitin-protein ligase HUWE1 [Exophiala viscosa]|uniref:HECT-type E3 ubiquitin transferase n=1 Tax=Exophiala viscosa TaxID=2486360 RepID=A0AAN6DNK5_9EURO|nr:E3 ubiquitin-protein ligase HUWE1 [Exophiala viscosa]KAI1628362.1 E3 ubiquitin-protein ligase HUWE1 [Exophiala viscosa]
MGKVTKKPQEKHKVSLSPAVSDLVNKVSTAHLADLPALFTAWSQRWPYPRGDLNNWIEPLDRFDTILEKFNTKYGLDKGPQTTPFGTSLLLEGSPGTDEKRLKELGFGPEGDRELVEAILVFSKLLVEKCANRAVYNSTDRLNDLLNTTSLSLLHTTLRITFYLAQRYAERTHTSHHLTVKFYDFDHERLQKLAAPFGQPLSPTKRGTTSPVKVTKSKEKLTPSGKPRRSSTAVNPNDFRSLCKETTSHSDRSKSTALPDRDWQTWAHVRVSWSPQPAEQKPAAGESSQSSDTPSTPTPVRQQSSGLSRMDTNGTSSSSPSRLDTTQHEAQPELKHVELSPSDLSNTSIESILLSQPEDMPPKVRYELLHQLRVAHGLMTSAKTRKELLAIRLLSIASLANVFNESELSQKLFPVDQGGPKPHDLISQLVSLIHDSKKGQPPVSLYLQTIAMETMSVLARFKIFASDINGALGGGSSQGLLSQLILKGLSDIGKDNDSTDTPVGDDWREAVFSMPRTLIQASGHHGRSSEATMASSFITTYLAGFNVTTGKALRVHLRMLDFIKTFFHHFKDGLTTLLASNAFESISGLLAKLVNSAWTMLQAGDGIPAQYKTRATDYDIPYMHQQIIRSIIDMINDISTHQGTQADRVLRSFVDSPNLLRSFRLITDHLAAFGAHTWSEVVKAICGFLHNEPTSYTVISEAGLIQSLLETVNVGQTSTVDPQQSRSLSSEPEGRVQGIPPVIDAIVNISQVFGAVCLTNAGFDYFKASGALEKFFEIFESPAHAKVLSDPNVLALLGSTFDELIRHHPNLRTSVLSAVIVMISRVRHITRSLAVDYGAGPKIWVGSEGAFSPCGGVDALSLEIVPPPTTVAGSPVPARTIDLPNGDKLSLKDSIMPPSRLSGTPCDQDSHGLKANDYARPAIGFLVTFFENQTLCNSFLDHGGCDLVLDFVTMPSLPADSQPLNRNSGLLVELAAAVHMMAECKPHVVLPTLADRTRYACAELKHFSQGQPKDWSCYFLPMVRPVKAGRTTSDVADSDKAEVELAGTRVAKALMAVLCLGHVLAEVFNAPMYSTRTTQNTLFNQVNLADILADICKMMGTISAACFREDIAIQRVIPQGWAWETRARDFTSGDDEVDKIWMSVRDSNARLTDDSTPSQDENTVSDSTKLEDDKQTPFFKNVQTLRFLFVETPAAITEFLERLGRGITGRRRSDGFSRQKAALVANALASAYLTQLQPYFLETESTESTTSATSEDVESRFTYFVIALDNVRRSFYDDGHPPAGPNPMSHPGRQSFVVEAFRKVGGVKSLTAIGTEFFDKLKSCKVEHSMFSANTGLKICLGILDDFTNSKLIMESAQANIMRVTDPTKQIWFVPAQVLLSLRTEALPLTRLVWESDYADQASKDVVQKLVSILKHVLTGDHENEAVQSSSSYPALAPYSPRKLFIDSQKVSLLKDKGYDEELAREALYRASNQSSNSLTPAEEYCKAFSSNPWRRRLPIPYEQSELSATTRDTPSVTSPPSNSIRHSMTAALLGVPSAGSVEAALAEFANNAADPDEMEDVVQTPDPPSSVAPRPAGTASSAMDLNNILNNEGDLREDLPQSSQHESTTTYSVETITEQRAEIREDLADRCNNILNNHQNLTFELSDLIISATKKLPDDLAKDYWRTTSDLLVSSLLSMQVEEDINEARGKKIAAAAHLVALLIQDGDVFDETLSIFQESFAGLLSYLRLPASDGRSAEDSFPWIAPVLLIVEKMLSRGSEPAEVKWNPPHDLDSSGKAELTPISVLDQEEKLELFETLVNMLTRVGKDKTMAVAITRVLVILTRSRDVASRLAERRNLQRLFLMVKQLANGVGHRLQSSFMIVLRHIVEDEETVKQIMRSEIKAHFIARGSKQVDTTSYVRDLYHLVLRSPEVFAQITNEMVKLSSWQQSGGGSIGVVLRETSDSTSTDEKKTEQAHSSTEPNEFSMEPAASVEPPEESIEDRNKSKALELRVPVVENPDGVIHFILSELLNYKDVEDKEVGIETPAKPDENSKTEQSPVPESSEDALDQPPQPKPEKPKFKPEDHPIFSYRCFLMYSLTELLHSYNRTKVELINFSRKADPLSMTPSKPRAGILNYLLNGLIPSCHVEKEESLQFKKKLLTSDWAIRVVVALCSKTGESRHTPAQRFSAQAQVDDADNEPDLTFVQRFVLEHAIKSYKDAMSSNEVLQMKYSRLLCLADMFHRLISKPVVPEGSAGSQNTSYKVLARMMFEKNLIAVLTNSLADIDLGYPGSKRVIKFILRPLQELTTLASQLSITDPDFANSVAGNTADDIISSASSVSDVDEEREETPDLFRNSALGMLDPNRDSESDSEEQDEDEDEEMYDEEYDDEMEYDDGLVAGGPNDDEAVSDDEVDDEMGPEGEIEGLPGDVPMDIEFVVNDPHMEVDTDDDDEDNDEDDDSDDDEDDDDGDDEIIVEEDEDDDHPDEFNGDEENDSLHGGQGDEGEWEDEEEGDEDDASEHEDDIEEITFDGDDMPVPMAGGGNLTQPGVLSSLLRVLNDHDIDGPIGMPHHVPPELIVPGADHVEPDDEDDEDEEDEDGDEMDENDEMDYGDFDHFLAGGGDGDIVDHTDPLLWNGLPNMRRARHFRGPGGHMASFVGRRVAHRDEFIPMGRPRLPQHARSGLDDGTNPLLRRPQQDTPRPSRLDADGPPLDMEILREGGGFPPFPATFQTVIRNGDTIEAGGHGAMLDAILQALHRGERVGDGRIQFSMTAPLSEIGDVLRPPISVVSHRPHTREESSRAGNFIPALTMTRWQEEARILFGNTYFEKVQRVQYVIMSLLVPLAQQEEKERKRKREEEQKAEREEMERLRVESERRKQEAEEREAAVKAEGERLRAEAEAEAATRSRDEVATEHDDGDTEPMEDVQGTDTQEHADSEGEVDESQPRIFTTIRGRQLDITGLDIDSEYLEALPEELREEVIMAQYATRREQARETGNDSTGIDPDFLNALPEDIREEIRQQEAHAQRRREREAARRQVATAGGPAQAEEMDNDTFLATLDPAFRRVILAEQPPEILRQLDPRHAAEGRAHARRFFQYANAGDRDARATDESAQRDNKRQIVQMVDKSGVATILRLMFLPQQGSLRTNLWHVLRNICGNRQTRFEVINLLLVVLKEGSTDVSAVERSLASLSLRAKATVGQKTPQPLKRTISMQPARGISEDVTPLVVVQQCLSALKQLCQNSVHTRTIFLREVDVNPAVRKGKGKAKEAKIIKYPINDLVGLLDRKLIVESSSCLQSLAELLSAVTQPLSLLLRKDKEKPSDEEKPNEGSGNEESTSASRLPTEQQQSEEERDIELRDAPTTASQGNPSHASSVVAEQGGITDPATKPETGQVNGEEAKSKKAFEPPEISEHNLELVVSIFVAPECNSDTFHSALETVSSLSNIPGTSVTFRIELIKHVKSLSQSICADLDELIPQLREAQSITDLHALSSSKFSHGGSDQVKLLRVLQALDYLSASKNDVEETEDQTTSYDSLALRPLWDKLSECLTTVREKDNITSFATILLPLIESLMVVCKNASLKDSALARQIKEQMQGSPAPEVMDDIQELFFNFTTEHRKILNDIIRQTPKLMQGNGSFSLLVKNPKVLDFDNKRTYFTKQIHSRLHQQRHIQPPLQLNVRRDQIFLDSYKALYYKTADEMKYGKLNIRFNGEEGVDAGGVTREWFQVLARGMFNPDWALWQPVAADRTTFHPNPLSWINGEHLLYFKFIGRIIGKALHEGRVLDCHFSRAVYKRLLGKEPNLKDLESMDLDYYKSLVWILENDITDVISEDFSVIEEQFGEEKVVDLIPNGRNIPVTEENKKEYVNAQVRYRLTTSVQEQLENFTRGFHDIIPAELVRIFDEQELELLVSGLPEIDVDDWKAHTEYHNYTANSPQITWFWRIVRGMSNEERAKLLQFVTGTSKVPLNGFKDLEGMQGNTLFSIHKDPSQTRLPTSHTCFNQLDLPSYDDYETLKSNLMTAINLGADYFGFA